MASVFDRETDVEVQPHQRDLLAEFWRKFERGFIKRYGTHLLILGITGSGKTQSMFWILEQLKKAEEGGKKRKETIVWFDTGKSDFISQSTEFLTLKKFGKLNVLIPKGCEIEFDRDHGDSVKVQEFELNNFWEKIERRRINVACIERYVYDVKTYGRIFLKIFNDLLDQAHKLVLKIPMAIFFDEIHRIAPPKQQANSKELEDIGYAFKLNVERLRSLGIRFIASSHAHTNNRKDVRDCFPWILIKKYTAGFDRNYKKLNDFLPRFRNLDYNKCHISPLDLVFSPEITQDFYPYDEGYVKYIGKINKEWFDLLDYNNVCTDKRVTLTTKGEGQFKFRLNKSLLDDIRDIIENRVDIAVKELNGQIALKFKFDEDGRFYLSEFGEIACTRFLKDFGLVGKIRGRSKRVEVNKENKEVIAYWDLGEVVG